LLLVIVALVVGMLRAASKNKGTGDSERVCLSAGFIILGICLAIAANLLFGWIFLLKFKIASPIWSFWAIG